MCDDPETFMSLVKNKAHWQFEIFIQAVVDGIILGIFWPWIKRLKIHIKKHEKCEQSKDN